MSKTLPIFIFSIFADVVCSNSIARIFAMQSYFSPLLLTLTMLGLQMLAAPLQAGFSDFHLRKKGLMIALFCSGLSLIFFSFAHAPSIIAIIFLWLGLVTNSFFGNTIPIVWSALADEQKKNLRFSFALTTCAYPTGYIMLAFLTLSSRTPDAHWKWEDIIIPSTLLILSFVFVWKYYWDTADKRKLNNTKKPGFVKLACSEFFALLKQLQNSTTLFGLLAYFLWASSQYSSLLTLVNSQRYAFEVIVMMIGYFVGVGLLGFSSRIRDEKMIRRAFILTTTAFALFFVLTPLLKQSNILLPTCGFFYTMGNAFLSSTIFTLFSKEREIHEQGKGFGLIVAADSAGFFVGIIAERISYYFKIQIEYVMLFSFLVFLISWFPYRAYEKRRKNAARISHVLQ